MPDHALSKNRAVQDQLNRLNLMGPGRDVLGLSRITMLLDRLGNPQHDLPPVFHIAGTNGKGSTCAFLRAAIEAAGLKPHIYTSPHLCRFNERIRIAGELIDDEQLAIILEEVIDIAADLAASFFEVTTAAAFLAFARHPADATIVEVGLGGRLDATNVLSDPLITGIAALGLDHEGFLLSKEPENRDIPADDLARIAYEKAGIAKAGTPLVTQRYDDAMQLEIAKQVMRVGAQLLDRGEAWDAAVYSGKLYYKDQYGRLELPLPCLPGLHQADNAGLAVAMLRHQNALSIPISALRAAMGWVKWPARLQKLDPGPVTAHFSANTEIWLDGGHNPSAGRALARHFAGNKVHAVLGVLSNKDIAGYITPLLPNLTSITIVPVAGHAAHDAQSLHAALGPNLQVPLASAPDMTTALRALPNDALPVFIGGSLYLAGAVLSANDQEPV